MRVGQIVDATIKLLRRRGLDLLTIALIISIPVDAIGGILNDLSLPSHVLALKGHIYYFEGESVSPLGALWQIAVDLLVYPLMTGALLRCLLEDHAGRPTSWRASLAYAASRSRALVALAILTGIGVVVGAILLILPAVYLYVAWIVSVPVLMFEGTNARGALGRSRHLVSGRWWPTFGVVLIGLVVAVIVEVVIGLISHAVLSSLSSVGPILLVRAIAQLLAHVFTAPFIAALTAMIYVDLRTRKEGFDLELLAESLATGNPMARPAVAPSTAALDTTPTPADPERSTPPPGFLPSTPPPGPDATPPSGE